MKNNILIIDDEANKGWMEVLTHMFFEDASVEAAISLSDADSKVDTTKYNLIFLDLRFGEKDHNENDIQNLGGFSILKRIRNDFFSKNFSTPIILFTASNKAWYINAMLEAGCDNYYIKEHLNTSYDNSFTKNNTKRLKNTVGDLLRLGVNRYEVWKKINSIIKKVEHSVPQLNIRQRILEKCKIGYGMLFKRVSDFEKEHLLYNNEVLSYVVFWSILEELSHAHYNRADSNDPNWTLRHSKKQIQYLDSEGKLITYFDSIKKEFVTSKEITNDYKANQIKLSNQIAGILRYNVKWT